MGQPGEPAKVPEAFCGSAESSTDECKENPVPAAHPPPSTQPFQSMQSTQPVQVDGELNSCQAFTEGLHQKVPNISLDVEACFADGANEKSENNEENEEAYILAAFRDKKENIGESHGAVAQGTRWRQAVEEASTAAEAVLKGMAPLCESRQADVEGSPPSVESLRATLQELRAKDDNSTLVAAKTAKMPYMQFNESSNGFCTQKAAAALETAALNLASAAAQAVGPAGGHVYRS